MRLSLDVHLGERMGLLEDTKLDVIVDNGSIAYRVGLECKFHHKQHWR